MDSVASLLPTYLVVSKLDRLETSVTRLGNLLDLSKFLKPLATINLPKSLTFLVNFCRGVKVYHFSSAVIFGQLL